MNSDDIIKILNSPGAQWLFAAVIGAVSENLRRRGVKAHKARKGE